MLLQAHQHLSRLRAGPASRRCNAAFGESRPALARNQYAAAAQALQAVDALQEGQGPSVLVKLSVPYSTPFGSCIKAVGSLPELGNWNVQAAPSLEWTTGDIWVGDLQLPSGTHEFKVVVAGPRGEVNWEPCGNRTLEVPETPGILEVPCSWGDTNMEVLFTGTAQLADIRARSPSPMPLHAQADLATSFSSRDASPSPVVLEPAASVAAVIEDSFRKSRSPAVEQQARQWSQSPQLTTTQPQLSTNSEQPAPDSSSDAANYTQRQTQQALALVTCLSLAVGAFLYVKDPASFPVSLPTSLPTSLPMSIPANFPTSLPTISLPASLPAPPTFNLPAMFSVADNAQ